MNDRLRLAAAAYGLAIAVHLVDHLRRGVSASPGVVIALGTAALLFQVVAIAAALARHRLAPVLAVAVGLPDAIGVFAVHLLPRWSGLSDAFAGAARAPGVTAFSWVTGIAEVATALAFAAAGWMAWSRWRVASS
jgi:hypothetical protein